MRTIKFFTVFIILLSLSCTIRQEYHFNKDFSGKARTLIDFSLLNKFIKDSLNSNVNNNDSLEKISNRLIGKFEEIKGIDNVKVNWSMTDGKLILSYSFKDIESLNNALNPLPLLNEIPSMNYSNLTDNNSYFVKKGKNLIYVIPPVENKDVKPEELDDNKAIIGMMKYELAFSFDRKIRTVKSEKIPCKTANKMVEMDVSFDEIFNREEECKIIVKLK